jgi:hypothetical protein
MEEQKQGAIEQFVCPQLLATQHREGQQKGGGAGCKRLLLFLLYSHTEELLKSDSRIKLQKVKRSRLLVLADLWISRAYKRCGYAPSEFIKTVW